MPPLDEAHLLAQAHGTADTFAHAATQMLKGEHLGLRLAPKSMLLGLLRQAEAYAKSKPFPFPGLIPDPLAELRSIAEDLSKLEDTTTEAFRKDKQLALQNAFALMHIVLPDKMGPDETAQFARDFQNTRKNVLEHFALRCKMLQGVAIMRLYAVLERQCLEIEAEATALSARADEALAHGDNRRATSLRADVDKLRKDVDTRRTEARSLLQGLQSQGDSQSGGLQTQQFDALMAAISKAATQEQLETVKAHIDDVHREELHTQELIAEKTTRSIYYPDLVDTFKEAKQLSAKSGLDEEQALVTAVGDARAAGKMIGKAKIKKHLEMYRKWGQWHCPEAEIFEKRWKAYKRAEKKGKKDKVSAT
jgi:hypothetical protein